MLKYFVNWLNSKVKPEQLHEGASKIHGVTSDEFHKYITNNKHTLRKVTLLSEQGKEINTMYYNVDGIVVASRIRWPNHEYFYIH